MSDIILPGNTPLTDDEEQALAFQRKITNLTEHMKRVVNYTEALEIFIIQHVPLDSVEHDTDAHEFISKLHVKYEVEAGDVSGH